MRKLSYAKALGEALIQSMDADESIFVTGIAADYRSGLFGSTTDVIDKFAPDRIFDAPAMENALTGIGIGAAAVGMRPVLVHPRVDFMFLALDQMLNLAAKWKYMYGGQAGTIPLVVRAIIGRGWGQGATHSQSLQSIVAHFPGIKVLMPTFPDDAKGLLTSALREDGPVLLLEHRSLFNLEGDVPESLYTTPIGKARVVRDGTDVTVVSTSFMTVEAQRAAEAAEQHGVSVEVVDLRSIRPLDTDTIIESVRKTGRLIVADTSWTFCGVAAEVAAVAAERAMGELKAPVIRMGQADCPAPVSLKLEEAFYPKATDIARAILQVKEIENSSIVAKDFVDGFRGPY